MAIVMTHLILSIAVSLIIIAGVNAFVSSPRPMFGVTSALFAEEKEARRAPSKVVDPDGPTPDEIPQIPEIIALEDLPESHYNESDHPIPYQPWRRGETNGCEDPIDAEWRQMAERVIYEAAQSVGGEVLDVTWYLTQLVISLNDDFSNVEMYTSGPPIEVIDGSDGPQYLDPEDPNPEDIWLDEEPEFLVDSELGKEPEIKKRKLTKEEAAYEYYYTDDGGIVAYDSFATPKRPGEEEEEEDEDEDEKYYSLKQVSPPVLQETREDLAGFSEEEEVDIENEPTPSDYPIVPLDISAISTVARAILDGLEAVEADLDVLGRHHVILASPSNGTLIETQSQFDAHVGDAIVVQTVDPWQSNRILRGTLLERNSMDLLINKEGRMVTIPLNFVMAVRVANAIPTYNGDDYRKVVENVS